MADVVLEVSMRGRSQEARVAAAEEEENNRVAVALAAEEDPGAVGLRRPDYSFRVGGRTRFLVEADRAIGRHRQPAPIYQLTQYDAFAHAAAGDPSIL